MIPMVHQEEGAKWTLDTVREHGIAYLIWQERARKTLTACLAVENSLAKTCLIVTKKRAIDGWMETLDSWKHKTKFVVINYESVHKIRKGGKIAHLNISTGKWVNMDVLLTEFDFIILDEAHHAIASIGRPSTTWKAVAKFTKSKPIIYLSATPYAETVGQLYHQFKLSTWSPWKRFKNYYAFHEHYGIPHVVYTSYGPQPDRSKFRVEEVLATVDHLFNFKTRAAVGIKHEPSVNVVIVPLNIDTTTMINTWTKQRVLEVGGYQVLGDSDSKMRMVHYQLEGGTLKIDDKVSIFLPQVKEKIEYIRENYVEKEIAIMAHFIKERELLEITFPKATILSSDGHAEGIDLHKVDKLLVYSMSFKTSKHTQRTARQANHDRDKPIEVDILVADKPAIGKYVYDAVAIKKENFVKTSYERSICG